MNQVELQNKSLYSLSSRDTSNQERRDFLKITTKIKTLIQIRQNCQITGIKLCTCKYKYCAFLKQTSITLNFQSQKFTKY